MDVPRTILDFHEKLNAAGVVPSYRRNDLRYPLVSCVNNVVACLSSKNYDAAALFVNRADRELSRLRQAISQSVPDDAPYFDLVERYLSTVQDLTMAIQRLKAAGLLVFGGDPHLSVHRPMTIPGNRREGYTRHLTSLNCDYHPVEEKVLDSPDGHLWRESEGWSFVVWDVAPGPGPGDFKKGYRNLAEAVGAVLDYYFGDPAWMCAEYDTYRRTSRST